MSKKGLTLVEMFIVIIIIAVLAAIAIPFIIRFGAKAPQAEAKSNLASIATTEIAYFAESKDKRWGKTFEEIGWAPTGFTKYVYFLTPTEFIYAGKSPGKPDEYTAKGKTPAELGLVFPINFAKYKCPAPGVSANGFTAVAIGNMDADETLDVWWIDSSKTPHNSQDDVNQ